MTQKLTWQKQNVPGELRIMLREIGEHYSIQASPTGGTTVSFEKIGEPGQCEVTRSGRSATVRYSTPAQAARAVGALLSGLVRPNAPYREDTPFTMLGIMLDCSRNAVMTIEHVRVWLRRLSLLGYNMVMLYTEDTYELPGEPWFGYQRGAYTRQELRQIVAYASKLNIDIIPCIQTLGHCGKFLRHPAYADIRDTSEVMLVGENKTYQLIEKMVKHWKGICPNNRIHIGMDETHGLGTGQYRQRHGDRNPFDIFNEHLDRVVAICKKHGLEPMIWSDMYFRLGSKTEYYYDPDTVIPKRVIKQIPKDVELVYWDYYHDNEEFYLEWIKRHRAMGKEPLVGSGIWTWNKHWHDYRLTEGHAGPCIDACRQASVKELFFTQWGDNGAFCDFDSAFCGMTWCADKAYGSVDPKAAALEKRFAAVCGGSYQLHHKAGDLAGIPGGPKPNMWDDPLFENQLRAACKDDMKVVGKMARHYALLAEQLKPHLRSKQAGSMRYAYATADAFAKRYQLIVDLHRAYRKKDRKAIAAVRDRITPLRQSIRSMAQAFRDMWMSHNKPLGIETVQMRFGAVLIRYEELARRLGEYAKGKVDRIPELDRQR